MGQQHNQPGFTDQSLIRNFCIIAHIDHGKSTVADRILQLSGIVPEREMRDRFLDRMDIEQERGITIKSQAVRVPWTFDGTEYTLGMIDTPGHVDFTYEVSRALAACEGAVLLVDATQGIEAQTLSNLYMAIDHDLAIIPVLNKIDLPSAEPDKHAEEIAGLIGCDPSEVLRVSGKTGEGVTELLDRIVADVPAPTGDPEAPARALIFDSVYDSYRGIVTYIRMVDGELRSREKLHMMGIGMTHDPIEIGVISPDMMPTKALGAGEVGYVITGAKDVSQSKVGDTITSALKPAADQTCDLLGMLVRFCGRQVDFVEHGDDGQIMVDGHIQIGQGLRLDALGGVDEQHRAFAGGQCAGHLIGEVHVAGGVDHTERVFGAVKGPRHAHGLGFDGDATLLLDIHTVEEAIAHLSLGHNAAQLQDAVGHGRLAVVDVCDDTEVANHRLIRGTRLIVLDDQRIPPLGIYSNFT